MRCIIPRHVAAAVTARGRTAAGEHNALNAQITLLPSEPAKHPLNLPPRLHVNLIKELVEPEV